MKKREKGAIHIPRGWCETHEDLEYLVGDLATITRGGGGSEEDKESATDNENQHTDSRQVCRHVCSSYGDQMYHRGTSAHDYP